MVCAMGFRCLILIITLVCIYPKSSLAFDSFSSVSSSPTASLDDTLGLADHAFPLGKIGCLFDEVCSKDEFCYNDELFGSCREILDSQYANIYAPDRRTLDLLVTELSRLVDENYTWKHGYVQCVVQHVLIAYQSRTVYDPRICEEGRDVASTLKSLDEEISQLLGKLVYEQDDLIPVLRSLQRQIPTEFDQGSKRSDLLNVHKYDTDYRLSNQNPVNDLSNDEPGNFQLIPNDFSDEDLKLLFYLQNILSENDKNDSKDYSYSESQLSELYRLDPSISPDTAGEIVRLLNGDIKAEDLSDNELKTLTATLDKLIRKLGLNSNDKDDSFISPTKSTLVDEQMTSKELYDLQKKPDKTFIKKVDPKKMIKKFNFKVNSNFEEKGNSLKTSAVPDLKIAKGEETSVRPDASTVVKDYKNVDFNYAYIDLEDRIRLEDAVSLVHVLESTLKLDPGSLELEQVDNNIVTIHVPSSLHDITAKTIATAAVDYKDRILKELGMKVISSGFGTQVSHVRLDDLTHHHRYFILTFVLCGTIAVILIVVVVIYLVRRHSHTKKKLAQLAGSADSCEASKDYQDLCRQRMQAKNCEKPEPISAASRISSVSESQVRSPSSRSSTSSWSEEPVVSNMDISTGHIVLSYMESHLKNKDRLEEEWRTLSSYEADPCSTDVARDSSNVRKNRFSDVLPYDHSRVILTDATNINQSDYINASTITDHDPRNPAYIATQAPLPHTVADFWQMIWEQGSSVLVMLTKLSENGISLCHRYWPQEGSDLYHIYEVHLVSEHIWCDDYLVRSFYLKNIESNETRTVTQFHFITWPENGTPPSNKSLLEFRRKVNKSYRGRSCPIVVHCSDGAGRTGTYCLLDMVLNRLAKGAKEIDIAATLEHIRDQRVAMVKVKDQFEFALACVADEVHAILKALPQ